MHFLLSELQTHRYIEKLDKIDPQPFLGPPPTMVEFNSPISATVRAELINTEVLVSGEVSTMVTCACARCLVNFDKKIEGQFKQSFEPVEDSIDVSYYIKEAVILDLPLKALCQENCLGLCPTCGQNKNEVTCQCPPVETHVGWEALKEFRFPKK